MWNHHCHILMPQSIRLQVRSGLNKQTDISGVSTAKGLAHHHASCRSDRACKTKQNASCPKSELIVHGYSPAISPCLGCGSVHFSVVHHYQQLCVAAEIWHDSPLVPLQLTADHSQITADHNQIR